MSHTSSLHLYLGFPGLTSISLGLLGVHLSWPRCQHLDVDSPKQEKDKILEFFLFFHTHIYSSLLCLAWVIRSFVLLIYITYRGPHAGLAPGLNQGVKRTVIISLRVAGVPGLIPQISLLVSSLLDFTRKIVQWIWTLWSDNR